MSDKIEKSDAAWRAALTLEQYSVCRQQATERPFSGAYHKTKVPGVYHCVACEQALFDAATKFDSGTGWPSFTAPLSAESVIDHRDTSHGMVRTEVTCSRCGSHLGHVFDDGPAPTGLRYCLNSVALRLAPRET